MDKEATRSNHRVGAGVGRRTTQIRERLGMSKLTFARRLGISRNTLADYERGTRIPKSEILREIAQLGGASMEWLLGGYRTDGNHVDPEWDQAVQRLRHAWRRRASRPVLVALLSVLGQTDLPSHRRGHR